MQASTRTRARLMRCWAVRMHVHAYSSIDPAQHGFVFPGFGVKDAPVLLLLLNSFLFHRS